MKLVSPDRVDVAQLAQSLRSMPRADTERLLEGILHRVWGDGCEAHEYDKNPYNILARVPPEFLKLAQEITNERCKVHESVLDQHLFPGMFERPASEPGEVDEAERRCGICMKTYEECDCAKTGRR